MLPIPTTDDIREELVNLYRDRDFRIGKYGKTVEIQNAHFLADKDWIIRKPNYDYVKREIEYLSNAYEKYTSAMNSTLIRSLSEQMFEKYFQGEDMDDDDKGGNNDA